MEHTIEHEAAPNSILEPFIGEKLRATIVSVKYNPTYGNAEVQLAVQVGNRYTMILDRLAAFLHPKLLAAKQKSYLTAFGYNINKLAKNAPVSDILYRAWHAQHGTYVHYVDVVPGRAKAGWYFVYTKTGRRAPIESLNQTEMNLD
jgi:hypothetical protein